MARRSKKPALFTLSIEALGVVYGDIGTSTLYAFRESLAGSPINLFNILGILSLIFWTLTTIISIKYLCILLRANNHGEGGILALLALIRRAGTRRASLLFFIAIIGAGLILGDGMLTPAISVLSAVEGLEIFLPSSTSWVVPLTCIIILCLFSVQRLGTAKIGIVFGPIIGIWFITLACLGIPHIFDHPEVLKAINPFYAYQFFHTLGWKGYALLGGVFLVTTGAEALYADLGHFGKRPIRLSWFMMVFPALVINYFGQGAFLLEHPEAIVNPFYLSAPDWFLVPLIAIATLATIIASQAIIAATFSVVRQAILLGLYPRLPIIQTSTTMEGQVYIPQMNLILLSGSLLLVFIFKNASALTHAYGIAVNLNMILTTSLILVVATMQWHWRILSLLIACLGLIDLAYLGANLQKLWTGGWLPILFASICALIMYSWQEGRQYLSRTYYVKKSALTKILTQFDTLPFNHIPEATAVFIADIYDRSGGTFLNFLKANLILPEKMILMNYETDTVPYVPPEQRFTVVSLKNNICALTLKYGFMDTISVPHALKIANEQGILPFPINIKRMMYLIEIPNVVATREKKTWSYYWRSRLFAFLVRNYSAIMDIDFYHLPLNLTITFGSYYTI